VAEDFLRTYKYGWKTSYYQNTNDQKSDEVKEDTTKQQLNNLIDEIMNSSEEDCESCKI
jgi:ribonucleoside-diphosphate reductase alpha chain